MAGNTAGKAQAGGEDSGLCCLAWAGRMHGIALDPDGLRQRLALGPAPATPRQLVRVAQAAGLRARIQSLRPADLRAELCPLLLRHRAGHWCLLAAIRDGRLLVQDPRAAGPCLLDPAELAADWSGTVILLKPGRPGRDGSGRFGLRWFLPALVRYRGPLGEVLAASLVLQLLALAMPLFFQVVVDKVLVHHGLATLDVLALGMGLVALFEAILGGLRGWLFSHTAHRIDVELGARLYRHLLTLPLLWFRARPVGDLVARVRELETLRAFLTGSSLTLVVDLCFTLVFLALMVLYSPPLTALVAGALPCYALLSLTVTPSLRARVQDRFDRGAENHAFLVESVAGIETVKALAVEPLMQRQWEERLAAYVHAAFRAGNLGRFAAQAATLIQRLVTLGILWLGARAVMRGELSVGQLVAFNMLAARVAGPVLRLVQLWQDFQQAGVSLQRLGDILDTPAEPGATLPRGRLPRLRGEIRFESVSFRYRPDGAEVVRDLSFSVAPGEVVALVGPSGSGKSTIAHLLQRLYLPERGRILIDGMDLATLDPLWLRRQVAVVLQENRLFDRTVRENIALADPAMPLARVVEAARLAAAHGFISALPEGYETRVGEGGARLSGGQRQRIAIARALASDPRILILDEATSALDAESEWRIQHNLPRVRRGRTLLIIAHRLSTVRQADRILVLDQGRIREQGSHQALLRQGGLYARLYRLQQGGERPARVAS